MSDPDPADATYDADFLIALREPGQKLRVVHDHHVFGVFPEETWRRLIEQTGLEVVAVNGEDPNEGEHVIFVACRPRN